MEVTKVTVFLLMVVGGVLTQPPGGTNDAASITACIVNFGSRPDSLTCVERRRLSDCLIGLKLNLNPGQPLLQIGLLGLGGFLQSGGDRCEDDNLLETLGKVFGRLLGDLLDALKNALPGVLPEKFDNARIRCRTKIADISIILRLTCPIVIDYLECILEEAGVDLEELVGEDLVKLERNLQIALNGTGLICIPNLRDFFNRRRTTTTTASTTEAQPTTESTTEAQPTTESTTEAQPTTESTTQAQPTTESTTEAQPTTESTTQAQPTTESTTEAQPTTESTTEAQPTTELTTEAQPTTASTTEAQPTTASTTEAQPTTASTTEAQPTTASTRKVYPTTASTTAEYPTTASTTEEYPTTASTTEEYPTTASTRKVYPTTASTTEEYPSTASTTEEYPTASTTECEKSETDVTPLPYPGCLPMSKKACKDCRNGDYFLCFPHCMSGRFVTCSNGFAFLNDCPNGHYGHGHPYQDMKLVFDPIKKRCEHTSVYCPRLVVNN